MTGPLILKTNPAKDLEAATKQYVDNHTSDVILYTPQSLTNEQQAQARRNINAASGGYGLGNDTGYTITAADDLDTIIKNGVYQWGDYLPKNAPYKYCKMRVWSGAGWVSQEIMSAYSNIKDSILRRVFNNNSWGPFEWVNPPMQLGIEYRTTERYLGKSVYCKVVNCGSLPSNAAKVTEFEQRNIIDKIVSVTGNCNDGGMVCTSLPAHVGSTPNWDTVILVNATSTGLIQITTFISTVAEYKDAYIMVKYTKLAD